MKILWCSSISKCQICNCTKPIYKKNCLKFVFNCVGSAKALICSSLSLRPWPSTFHPRYYPLLFCLFWYCFWYDAILDIEPETFRTWSQHSTTRLSKQLYKFLHFFHIFRPDHSDEFLLIRLECRAVWTPSLDLGYLGQITEKYNTFK